MILEQYLDFLEYEDRLTESEILIESMSDITGKSVESLKKNSKVMVDLLKDHGISMDSIESTANKITKKIKNLMNRNLSPKEASKEVSKELSDSISSIVMKVHKSSAKTGVPVHAKFLGSLSIFILLLVSQIVSTAILVPMVGNLTPAITSLIIAPLTEETAKRVAIGKKYPFFYTGFFSGIEFIGYVIPMINAGASIPGAIIVRLAGVLLHFTTTMIQKYIIDKYGIESVAGKLSWVVAVIIHMIYNTLALVFNNSILRMMGV